MVEPDVLRTMGYWQSNQVVGSSLAWHLRFKPGLSDFFIYAASATVDGTVLRGHDSLK
jgi:hypothetical protein